MFKVICDKCGDEVKRVSRIFRITINGVELEVQPRKDYCNKCLKGIIHDIEEQDRSWKEMHTYYI